MRKTRSIFWLTVLLVATGLGFGAGDSATADLYCEEGILIWSHSHNAWICSPSSGGGQVCTVCWDETDATPPDVRDV